MSHIYESFIPVVHKCSYIDREQSKHAKNLFLDFAATESDTMHTIQIFQKEAFNGFSLFKVILEHHGVIHSHFKIIWGHSLLQRSKIRFFVKNFSEFSRNHSLFFDQSGAK